MSIEMGGAGKSNRSFEMVDQCGVLWCPPGGHVARWRWIDADREL